MNLLLKLAMNFAVQESIARGATASLMQIVTYKKMHGYDDDVDDRRQCSFVSKYVFFVPRKSPLIFLS